MEEPSTDKIKALLGELEGPPLPTSWENIYAVARWRGFRRNPAFTNTSVIKLANAAYWREQGKTIPSVAEARKTRERSKAEKAQPVTFAQQRPCANCRSIFRRSSPYLILCPNCRMAATGMVA